MHLKSIDGDRGIVESGGLEVEVSLLLIEGPEVGDYLLGHAGFAIERLNAQEAAETLEMIREMITLETDPPKGEG